MEKQYLDYVLVPLGLLMMIAYHAWLVRQIICRPTSTIIGVNAINRRLWVRAMMQDTPKNGILAVQTLRNNIMASTVLASTAIMLSSVIAVLMSGHSGGGRSGGMFQEDNSGKLAGFSPKFFAIIVCFLLAFLLNVQSIRYYSHASMLINVPNSIILESSLGKKEVMTAEYVAKIVNLGSYFWSLGLHVFYLSFPLILWIFGAVPMVSCCVLLVFMLYFLDVSFECGLSGQEDRVHDNRVAEMGTV